MNATKDEKLANFNRHLGAITKEARKVLDACFESSEGNGHDFGFVEDVLNPFVDRVEGMSRQTIGGHLTNLEKRGLIEEIYPPHKVNRNETVTQFVLGESTIEFLVVGCERGIPTSDMLKSRVDEIDRWIEKAESEIENEADPMEKHEDLLSALDDPRARILVHAPATCDNSGNSRARQKVYTIDGLLLFADGRVRSYWYNNENERRAFERRGGLVLCAD